MILHSIVPVEEILMGFENFKPAFEDVDVGGIRMQVMPTGIGQGKVVRLLSTDPGDYMKPEFQPGSLVQWSKKI